MNIDDAIFIVVDTETTGLDPAKDELIEIAAVPILIGGGNLGMFTTLVRPTKPIPPEVSAVHQLTNADLRNAPPLEEAIADLLSYIASFTSLNCPPVLVAHNAEFDRDFLAAASGFFALQPQGAYPWLCSCRLAKHLYYDAPNFKNGTLRYYHQLNVDTLGLAPHRALADALVTAANVRFEINDNRRHPEMGETVESLIAFVDSPAILKNMPLGKHRGPIVDVPLGYVQWALGPRGMTDIDKDLRYTLQRELQLRKTKGAA